MIDNFLTKIVTKKCDYSKSQKLQILYYFISILVVQHAKPTDSGTYSCSPSLGDTVSVNVHVLRGNGTSVIWVPMRV